MYSAHVPVRTSHTRNLANAVRAIRSVGVSIEHTWTHMMALMAQSFSAALICRTGMCAMHIFPQPRNPCRTTQALGLYGLIIGLIMASNKSEMC